MRKTTLCDCVASSELHSARPAEAIQQGCRGHGDPHGDFHEYEYGYGYGMGMRNVMNPHGPVGILWGILNGCEVKRKRVKHAIDVVVDV